MKIKNFISYCVIAAATFGLAACSDTDAQYTIPEVDAPVLVSSNPAQGEEVADGDRVITLEFDKNIGFASANYDKITLTGGGQVTKAIVYGASNTLSISTTGTPKGAQCTLTIPAGLIFGPNKVPAEEITLNYSTKAAVPIDANPVMATSAKAVALYNYLKSNYGNGILSGMMASVAWNNDASEQVYQWTGKYPAINGYDYIHMPASVSGANWINYNDITPVKSWADNGGIVTIGWHWLVPKKKVEASTGGGEDTPSAGTELWSGSQDIGTGWDWNSNVVVNAAAAKAGDVLRVSFSNNTADYHQLKVTDGSGNALSSYIDVDNGWGCIELAADATSYDIKLNETDAATLSSAGIRIAGYAITVTKVELLSGAAKAKTRAANPYASLNPNTDFTYVPGETEFDLKNATVEGTWEKAFVDYDLANLAACLKLVKDAGIPVLWRPLHEAAGGWFWWGTDAEACKALWKYMFNYLKAQGFDNLIWVWTSQTGDDNWYPGDEYVDIVGRDLYGDNATSCADNYTTVYNKYSNKIVTLSECGWSEYTNSRVANISDQWAAGAKWSWFMPWYDGSDAVNKHADEAWWKAAMELDYVITRDKVKF
ncbi:MAG: glycosyl hydrolase [Prevotella sp.]